MARVLFWDVDTQYDFMRADGKLYVPDAERLIPNLKRLTDYAWDMAPSRYLEEMAHPHSVGMPISWGNNPVRP